MRQHDGRQDAIVQRWPPIGARPGLATPAILPWCAALLLLLMLPGCASRGDRALDDGDEIPARIARIPDAVPRVEPLSKSGNPKSYVVFGKRYYTRKSSQGYVERGLASWYGKDFHGRKTSSGETYDMHGMSAAHKTLPLPTYARVTNVENGRSIVVKINDRGPFHGPRLIDLSYTAAVKLGVVKKGTAQVEVRAIDPRRPDSDSGPFLASQTRTRTQTRSQTRSRAVARTDQPRTRLSQPRPATPASTSGASSATFVSNNNARAGTPPLYLQIGAFGDPGNARRLRARLTDHLLADQIRIIDPDTTGTPLYKVRVGPLDSEYEADRLARRLAGLGLDRPQLVRH